MRHHRRYLRSTLRALYYGHTQAALRFQGVLFVVDLLIVCFFIASQFFREQIWFWVADAAIATFVAADLSARLVALGSVKRWLKYPVTWVDLVVLATLLLPTLLHNWGFLRILRLWSLVQSERFWNVLARGRWDETHVEDLSKAITTLVVFVFLAAGATQAIFLGDHPSLNNFADALYFVVTSLTTTGYGDITLPGLSGRLFSIALMIGGVTLFLRIAHRAFGPQRKIAQCIKCGVDRHEQDARFCRGCGAPLALAKKPRYEATHEGG